MGFDLYHMLASPPCHCVRHLAKYLGVPVNLIHLDYEKGEHKKPEFVKLNPQHTVPTINDNGFVINESRAVLGYLAEQYGKDDSLYPKDIKQRTLVNQRLYFDIGTLYQPFLDYYCMVFENGKFGEPSKLVKIEEAFQILDKYLEGQNWVAGKNVTIADFAILSSVAFIECCGFDVSKYSNVSKWYAKAQKTLTGYDDTIRPGCKALQDYFVKLKK